MTREPPPLVKRTGTALYRQVADDVIDRVSRGEFAPGERLEPEARLAERYGVNRLTVRRALEELARAGVVRTEHGVGSFIALPVTRHRIDDGEASLSESMARRGIAVRHRVIAINHREPNTDGPFPDFPGPTVEFRFVRFLEGSPWSIGEVLLPRALAPLDWDGSTSVFERISAEHGLTARRAEWTFSASLVGPTEAKWLGVPSGSAVLELRGHNVDQRGRVIATAAHRVRGDRAEYVVRLSN